ncbi:Zinc finger protein 638 [Collichthys lucidus]|uniref:Zinc finger protein 638 n=1 Tax=Collichthys lucidus TaxID=240159 RepID=A0A4V6XYG6_COLLU|nr:Zinc finger protein 638 [Collichthys lucidus]
MQKINRKKRAQRISSNLTKAAHHLAVHSDSNSHLAPSLRLEPSATFSIANCTRGTQFIFGSVAGAVTALRLAQIEIQTQIALQLATLATITVGDQCHNNGFAAATLPPHLAFLSLLSRQQVSASKTYRTQPCLSAAMYHHHSQQQGSQPFSNGPRPPHHQPPPNQHQNRPSSDMLSQVMGYQFPRPTQLPDELESALAIRGARDMDHRLIDHMNHRPNQHQNQNSGSGISQHGSYSSNPIPLSSDNQPVHQQGIDWSSYQPPTKLFATPSPSVSHQPQRPQGPQQQQQQQPPSSHTGTNMPNWTAPVSDSPSPQARHPHAGGVDGQGLYTPESAGSILASFGLSNEDLEVLSHYPDDQLTPDTLPFILRDIQINKSGTQKTAAPNSSSSFSRVVHDLPLPPTSSSPLARSNSPEVPSLLTVTQTAGKVIDYGHASRAKDDRSTRETFKRVQLSSERTVKMFPSSSSSSLAPKADKAERRQVRLEHTESIKHGDRDYRRTICKSSRSPGREFPPSSKSRNLDRDYRHDGPKPRPSSETRSEASSRRSLSSSSGSKPHSNSKKLPTPTMISDFSAVSPKVYPHTCSLCHTQCDQEKDWVDHINTVNHTAACRDLRNKYPDWKPDLPSRSGRYGSRALWDPKDHSPSNSVSRSLSHSPPLSPPHSKHRLGSHPHSHRRSHHHPHYPHYTGGSSRSAVKRPHDDSASPHPSSSKAGHNSKHGSSQTSKSFKNAVKPGIKTTKTGSAKAVDTSAKPPSAKKKKKTVTPGSQDSSVADRLVYLTGIPKDASEQEVTGLVGSFGKINNVILMPCSEEESEKGEGQKASVCMVKAEDAQALANSTDLSIREQQITALTAKKSMLLITGLPESGWSESDIIKLVQPFGTPPDIILATHIGKVLVTVPNMEIAQEMMKVHSFSPMKINDTELKMTHLKHCVYLNAPVALYNLLMGSVDLLESSVSVGWSSLLVISNVPSTPSSSSEVEKLVRRFGTVIKTLVLNSMVICEMATAAMALSVYKRFQTFPCIIQNNPLFFSRKPDPKANTQTRDTSANGKGQTTVAAEEEATAHKEGSECLVEGTEKNVDGKDDKSKTTEETFGEDEALGENESKVRFSNVVSDSLAAPVTKPETDPETDTMKTSTVGNVMETAEEKEDVTASKSGNDETPAGEATGGSTSDGHAASLKTAMPELPKVIKSVLLQLTSGPSSIFTEVWDFLFDQVTQEMVNALLVECRTRTASHPNNTPASTNGEQERTQTETEQGKEAAEETKEAKNHTQEDVKKQEKERKEREARKERERKDRERRVWEKEERSRKEREKEERARREREKREEERRESDRRERERRERKRSYGERSSGRMEGNKQSVRRDGHNSKTMVEEEDDDDFPFNLSDFVTVDEVGDVNDLPNSPSPTVPIETTGGGEDAPEDVCDKTMEVTTETKQSEAAETLKSENTSVSEPVTLLTAETSDSLVSSDSTPAAASPSPAPQSASSPSTQTHEPESPDTETPKTPTLSSTTQHEPVPTPAASAAPADSSSNTPAMGEVTAKKEEDKKEEKNHSRAMEEEMVEVSDKTEETQGEEEKETRALAVEPGKNEKSETQTITEEESVAKKLKTETPTSGDTLPPFDPSNPVGLEFLVPKTGFFCKVCNRFFSGTKEAEINHCKTLKHYQNLQKYLQTTKTTTKPESS